MKAKPFIKMSPEKALKKLNTILDDTWWTTVIITQILAQILNQHEYAIKVSYICES